MDIVLFGAGKFCKKRIDKLDQSDRIIAVLDNSVERQGETFENYPVKKPDEILNISFDYVLLMSLKEKEMFLQLIDLGVSSERILRWNEYQALVHRGEKPVLLNSPINSDRETILLLSTPIRHSGAPIALLDLGKELAKKYRVEIVSSYCCEDLKEKIIDLGIGLWLLPDLEYAEPEDIPQIQRASHIVANTYILYPLVCKISQFYKISFWIHEAEVVYELNYPFYQKFRLNLKNCTVFTVSEWARTNFHKYYSQIPTLIFCYGLPELSDRETTPRYSHLSVTFGILGELSERKGQDIFLEAYHMLPLELRERIYVLFGGPGEDGQFAKSLIENISEAKDNIQICGELTREQVNDFFEKIDVLVVPSRDDPMPIVAAEAFQRRKICVVSDCTGTASLIVDGVNGFTFADLSPDNLKEAILLAYDHVDDEKIKEKAYQLYLQYFSMPSLESRMTDILS